MCSFKLNFAVLLATVALINSKTVNYTITINPTNISQRIYTPFYGFTIDFWNNHDSKGKWNPNAGILTLNLSNENLIALTREVSPAILRVGGSPEDSVVYDINGECSQKYGLPNYDCSQTTNSYPYYGCINKTRWLQINEFAIQTNVTLIFGLNACYGRKSYTSTMNFSNIIALVNYTNSLGDKVSNLYGFEFGNELASPHTPPHRVNESAYAKDFYKLYQIIDNKYKILGNDGASPGYLNNVIHVLNDEAKQSDQTAKDILYRATYHHYAQCEYPNGTLVFSPKCLQDIINSATQFYNVGHAAGIPVWMGEGSEHTGGGTPNVSNTFVDNFYYVYQLCTVLQYNLNATLRSDLIGGDYELIDHHTFEPNPDYWILYIWKQLIGDAMFDTDLTTNANDRSAAFSFRATVSGGDAITLVLINFDMNNMVEFDIDIIGEDSDPYLSDEYYLKPYGSSLQTQLMYVNDVLMEYKDNQFPILKSVQGNGQNVTLDPARIAFVVLTPQ
eukprot:93989_1